MLQKALFPLLDGQRNGDVLVGLGTDWASCTHYQTVR
jgi:hypothetical protein